MVKLNLPILGIFPREILNFTHLKMPFGGNFTVCSQLALTSVCDIIRYYQEKAPSFCLTVKIYNLSLLNCKECLKVATKRNTAKSTCYDNYF